MSISVSKKPKQTVMFVSRGVIYFFSMTNVWQLAQVAGAMCVLVLVGCECVPSCCLLVWLC